KSTQGVNSTATDNALFSFVILSLENTEIYVDLSSRLPLYCRTSGESSSRRARHANSDSSADGAVFSRYGRRARTDSGHVWVRRDMGPPRVAVGRPRRGPVREEWLAHRSGVHSQRFDHGSDVSFRRDSDGADGRSGGVGGRRGGHGRELCGGGAEHNADRHYGDGVAYGGSQG